MDTPSQSSQPTQPDVAAIFLSFLESNEVDSTNSNFHELLDSVDCGHLYGSGLPLFDSLKGRVKPKLNYRVGRIFANLESRIAASQAMINSMVAGVKKVAEPAQPFRVLVCGAGPVGLRAAVEAAVLGLEVVVVEKRTAFSRANIITLWNETMDDLLSLGAKIIRPQLCSTGNPKHAGTRELQLVLLKVLLLLGGTVRYGRHVVGLLPPNESGGNGRWSARFVPYVRSEGEGAHELDAASKALAFQKIKDYEEEFEKSGNMSKLVERCDVDEAFVSGAGDVSLGKNEEEERVSFDAYFIAEGGWSHSTRKLGFDKVVHKRNPTFGLVINLDYDKSVPEEAAMKSRIYHVLGGDTWPLKECTILAEFLEYLKGETHFFAAVVSLENRDAAKAAEYAAQARGQGTLTPDAEAALELMASRSGLIELGVVKEKKPRAQLLQPDNLDAEALRSMARLIATECGLPPTTPFCETNPVQLFDFSSLARCVDALKILHADGTVSDGSPSDTRSGVGVALVCPIGDALWEPLWTSGLGINRGFHGGLNAAYCAATARHRGLKAACADMTKSWNRMIKTPWPFALAGEGSKGCVKTGKKWTADPDTRLK